MSRPAKKVMSRIFCREFRVTRLLLTSTGGNQAAKTWGFDVGRNLMAFKPQKIKPLSFIDREYNFGLG